MRAVRKGAAINTPGETRLPSECNSLLMEIVIASPAETARCAKSAAKRMVWRSWPARTEFANCGVSADTARSSKGPSRRRSIETSRVRKSSRSRSASASITEATSGVPCRAVATSARISARRCSSRDASPSRVASSRLPVVQPKWWLWRRDPRRKTLLRNRAERSPRQSLRQIPPGERPSATALRTVAPAEISQTAPDSQNGAAVAHGVCGYGALPRKQAHTGKTIRHLAIGLLADEFIARMAPPEINPLTWKNSRVA